MKGFSAIFFMLMFCAISMVSFANDGMPPGLFVEQESQSVCITLTKSARVDNGPHDLSRVTAGDTWSILDQFNMDNSDAFSTAQYCDEPDSLCEENYGPGVCVDCDGDSIKECPYSCSTKYFFKIADLCVPAGSSEYILEAIVEGSFYETVTDNIDVTGDSAVCADTSDTVCEGAYFVYDYRNNAPVDDDDDDDDNEDRKSVV